MKVTIVIGSRNSDGQTANAVDQLISGMSGHGIKFKKIFLPEINLSSCRQCDENGWGICIKEGKCVIEDDFKLIVDEINSSALIVFATPVYFSDLSESMKVILDRLRRICMNEEGKKRIKSKPVVGICVAGGGGGGSLECCVNLSRILGICGFELLDIIPVRRQNTNMKESILYATGKWICDNYR